MAAWLEGTTRRWSCQIAGKGAEMQEVFWRVKEAIDASHGVNVKHSHLAKVLVVGLQEWQYQQETGEADKDKEVSA